MPIRHPQLLEGHDAFDHGELGLVGEEVDTFLVELEAELHELIHEVLFLVVRRGLVIGMMPGGAGSGALQPSAGGR